MNTHVLILLTLLGKVTKRVNIMKVSNGINHLITTLRADQTTSGTWEYPFESSISTDTYMIILLRSLEIDDEEMIKQLVKRILSKQEENGAWKHYYDERGGSLSLTVEAYHALLYSGYIDKKDDRMKKAKRFILQQGGIEETHFLTKLILTITGQYEWPKFFPLPIELMLIQPIMPINFYSISVYGRANIVPIMIIAEKKFRFRTASSPDLSDLFTSREEANFSWSRSSEWRTIHKTIKSSIKKIIGLPQELHQLSMSRAKQYMMNHLEPDGTLFGYISSTFLMVFALLSLGHKKDDPLIENAVKGLYGFKTKVKGHTHIQFTTASVWNTSLLSYSLQKAGLTPNDPMIKKATNYLLSRQQYKFGDWIIHNPKTKPGAWGFSNINTFQPDTDDTSATLRAITNSAKIDDNIKEAWNLGVNWLVSMQNDDGGWPAFEKNTNNKLLALVPIQDSEFILTDPSSADLTGRAMEFLGNYTQMPHQHSHFDKSIEWLKTHQEKNGSWYGRWGICYIYGTWAALTGLSAIAYDNKSEMIKKATSWLRSIQNADGGYGESALSDKQKKYIPLGDSTLTHTAWAIDALISVSQKPDETIKRGIKYLLTSLDNDDWSEDYPAGQGLAGAIYFHYHSYRYIFPLLALSHYREKYGEE